MHSVINSIFAIELLSPLLRPQAYLDPGSGSLLIQMLLAVLLAVPFLIKGFWKKIKARVTRSSTEADIETSDDPAQQL